ncbi:MAG: hypothetical protein AMXMBFR23_03270 [Chloroflexota bacterium]
MTHAARRAPGGRMKGRTHMAKKTPPRSKATGRFLKTGSGKKARKRSSRKR